MSTYPVEVVGEHHPCKGQVGMADPADRSRFGRIFVAIEGAGGCRASDEELRPLDPGEEGSG